MTKATLYKCRLKICKSVYDRKCCSFCVRFVVYLVAIHNKSALAFVRINSEFRVLMEWTTVKVWIYEFQATNRVLTEWISINMICKQKKINSWIQNVIETNWIFLNTFKHQYGCHVQVNTEICRYRHRSFDIYNFHYISDTV